MDWQAHLAIFSTGHIDPIVFMRGLRAVFLFISAIIMLFEPMNCGGRNKVFHRVVASLFITGSWVSWDQMRARMALIVKDPVDFFAIVPAPNLFWSEFAFTVAAGLVMGRLLYDAYLFYRMNQLGCTDECGLECRADLKMEVVNGDANRA